jgi:hypothetical protein
MAANPACARLRQAIDDGVPWALSAALTQCTFEETYGGSGPGERVTISELGQYARLTSHGNRLCSHCEPLGANPYPELGPLACTLSKCAHTTTEHERRACTLSTLMHHITKHEPHMLAKLGTAESTVLEWSYRRVRPYDL